ncbi:MAG: hypothetical protein IPP77_13485 [Bacteroidetes bacterium]|nr:hypothetical protein [Bacteroidota bacterium]
MASNKPSKQKTKPAALAPKANAAKLDWELYANWALFAIYSLIVLYTVSNHEPWRDEAQSWLIARDNSLLGLFQYLPNEGHPPLWYLILMPFAKMGFSYAVVGYIHALIAIGCAWLILFKSRVPIYLRIAIIFSYFFLYEFAVIARNYSMVGLLLFAIVAIYEDRFKKPLLFGVLMFLLFQTNVLAFCAGGGLGLIYLIEIIREKKFNPKIFASLAIMGLGAIATIALLLSAGMESDYTKIAADKMGAISSAFGNALLLNKDSGWGIVLYILLALALFRKPMVLLFLAVGLAGYSYLVAYKFQGTLRHHGFLLTFLAAAYALAMRYQPIKKFEKFKWIETGGAILFSLMLGVQALKGFNFVKEDWERTFSDAKNAAEFINRNQLYNYTIVGHRSYAASAVVPYLPDHKPVWYADQQRFGTFVYLDTTFFHNYMKYSSDYAPYIAQQKFSNLDSVILLLNAPIQHPEFLSRWDLIYRTMEQPIKGDEAFFIYKYHTDKNTN